MIDAGAGALEIAGAVAAGRVSAVEIATAALDRIAAGDKAINAFTAVTTQRALAEAAAIDARRARGERLPALAGAPYAVKNLFDIAGLTTLAGSKINRDLAPAKDDAVLVQRMRAAGAVLLGALNMDEYAYGFTTENTHYGPTRNPHDTACVSGGSSGGSAAAVAAGFVPLALGSDTNGSIRVPASLCGIFGLKPTYGRLSRRGTYMFAASFDHLGPFARCSADLAASYDAMQGADALDPACARRAAEPATAQLGLGIADLRIAVLGDYFEHNAGPQALAARDAVCRALNVTQRRALAEAARARASAFVITSAEGAALHFEDLKNRPGDFDPMVRDRFLAGALLPAGWIVQAQRFRQWFRNQVLEIFQTVDILIAPATPLPAVAIGTETAELNGERVLVRPNMGLLTQPISFIGLPVVAVPVHGKGKLPIGVQIIAAPWQEAKALRVAAWLEREGVVSAPIAPIAPMAPMTLRSVHG